MNTIHHDVDAPDTRTQAPDTPMPVETTELLTRVHDAVANLIPDAAVTKHAPPSYRDLGWRKWL